jgi:hypothetical protein
MKKSGTGYLPVLRQTILGLPGVSEGICFGTAAFYVSKKLLARMKEDDKTLAVYTPDRDEWTIRDNTIFFITDHYKNYPYVLVRLDKVKKTDLTAILTEAWRSRAGKKLLQQSNK